MSKISILIADSQRLFAEALAVALSSVQDFSVLDERPVSGRVVLDAVELWKPDVAILDFWLGEIGGPAAASRISVADPHCKVILLSWFHGRSDIDFAFKAGAVGFLPKSVTLDPLIEAVRRAHAGEKPVLAKELQGLVKKLDERSDKRAEVLKRVEMLTPRELEILIFLSYGGSITQVAKQLTISPKTLKNHITKILAKTGTGSHSEAVAMARYCGLIQA